MFGFEQLLFIFDCSVVFSDCSFQRSVTVQKYAYTKV